MALPNEVGPSPDGGQMARPRVRTADVLLWVGVVVALSGYAYLVWWAMEPLG